MRHTILGHLTVYYCANTIAIYPDNVVMVRYTHSKLTNHLILMIIRPCSLYQPVPSVAQRHLGQPT